MYCPVCATLQIQPQSFCHHCGADLRIINTPPTKVPNASIESLLWATVGTTITLLGMVLGALVLIKEGKIDDKLGSIFVVFSFVALLTVDGLLIWRLFALNREAKVKPKIAQSAVVETKELSAPPTPALPDYGEPVRGITDQTTRTLDLSFKENKIL